MPSLGRGIEEIRIRDEAGQFRVVYVAKFADVVCVLHCFQKKMQRTRKRDIDLVTRRFKALMQERKP